MDSEEHAEERELHTDRKRMSFTKLVFIPIDKIASMFDRYPTSTFCRQNRHFDLDIDQFARLGSAD